MILTRFTVALAALGAWCVLATAAVPDALIPVTLVFVTIVSVLPVAVPSLAVTEARAVKPYPQGGKRRQGGFDFVFPQP